MTSDASTPHTSLASAFLQLQQSQRSIKSADEFTVPYSLAAVSSPRANVVGSDLFSSPPSLTTMSSPKGGIIKEIGGTTMTSIPSINAEHGVMRGSLPSLSLPLLGDETSTPKKVEITSDMEENKAKYIPSVSLPELKHTRPNTLMSAFAVDNKKERVTLDEWIRRASVYLKKIREKIVEAQTFTRQGKAAGLHLSDEPKLSLTQQLNDADELMNDALQLIHVQHGILRLMQVQITEEESEKIDGKIFPSSLNHEEIRIAAAELSSNTEDSTPKECHNEMQTARPRTENRGSPTHPSPREDFRMSSTQSDNSHQKRSREDNLATMFQDHPHSDSTQPKKDSKQVVLSEPGHNDTTRNIASEQINFTKSIMPENDPANRNTASEQSPTNAGPLFSHSNEPPKIQQMQQLDKSRNVSMEQKTISQVSVTPSCNQVQGTALYRETEKFNGSIKSTKRILKGVIDSAGRGTRDSVDHSVSWNEYPTASRQGDQLDGLRDTAKPEPDGFRNGGPDQPESNVKRAEFLRYEGLNPIEFSEEKMRCVFPDSTFEQLGSSIRPMQYNASVLSANAELVPKSKGLNLASVEYPSYGSDNHQTPYAFQQFLLDSDPVTKEHFGAARHDVTYDHVTSSTIKTKLSQVQSITQQWVPFHRNECEVLDSVAPFVPEKNQDQSIAGSSFSGKREVHLSQMSDPRVQLYSKTESRSKSTEGLHTALSELEDYANETTEPHACEIVNHATGFRASGVSEKAGGDQLQENECMLGKTEKANLQSEHQSNEIIKERPTLPAEKKVLVQPGKGIGTYQSMCDVSTAAHYGKDWIAMSMREEEIHVSAEPEMKSRISHQITANQEVPKSSPSHSPSSLRRDGHQQSTPGTSAEPCGCQEPDFDDSDVILGVTEIPVQEQASLSRSFTEIPISIKSNAPALGAAQTAAAAAVAALDRLVKVSKPVSVPDLRLGISPMALPHPAISDGFRAAILQAEKVLSMPRQAVFQIRHLPLAPPAPTGIRMASASAGGGEDAAAAPMVAAAAASYQHSAMLAGAALFSSARMAGLPNLPVTADGADAPPPLRERGSQKYQSSR